jgi:hypothetical protein
MLGILAMVAGLACLICQIIVAVKIFQTDGALKGIIALLCGLFGLIWGWMNADRLGVKQIMMIWSLLIVVYIILAVMSGGFSYSMGTPPVTP